jgi:hypothetical protein
MSSAQSKFNRTFMAWVRSPAKWHDDSGQDNPVRVVDALVEELIKIDITGSRSGTACCATEQAHDLHMSVTARRTAGSPG